MKTNPEPSIEPNAEPAVRPAYLDYAPVSLLPEESKVCNYRTYLDRLGFDTWDDPVAYEARQRFMTDLRTHICVPETIYLRKEDNPAVFEALIQGFLVKYADRYWGTKREHLAEKDPLKGFLYPRDVLRNHSRLRSILEDLFAYRAYCFRYIDNYRPAERQVVPHIDFSALRPQDIDGMGLQSAATSVEGSFKELDGLRKRSTRKRQTPSFRDSSDPLFDSTLHTSDLSVPVSRAESPSSTGPIPSREKRQRQAPNSPTATTSQTATPAAARNARARNTKRSADDEPGLLTPSPAEIRGRRPSTAQSTQLDNRFISTSDDSASEPETTFKIEKLPAEILAKTTLLVTASNLSDMAPVLVKLECFKGVTSFLDFLAEECVLGDAASKVTDASVTYTWNGRKHRLRKTRLDVDWLAFCDELRDAFRKNPIFLQQGCEVEMLLHVAV